MLRNHIIIAWRNLWKNRMLSLINISGLSIGIATCFLISLYVVDELSYDQYHEKADQIYRVVLNGNVSGEIIKEAVTMPPMTSTLQREFPEVLKGTRLRNFGTPQITFQDHTFRDSKFALVDANFFEVFTLPLIQGDLATALKEPNTVVITRDQARKYFGETDPLGKILEFKEWEEEYTVTGVIEAVPYNSHFRFDFFGSMEGLEHAKSNTWVESNYFSYLLLGQGTNYKILEQKLPQILDKYMGPQIQDALGMSYAEFKKRGNSIGLFLQPLKDIHLRSDFASITELEPGGDIKSVYILSVIAIFIIFIACINFINLSTAAASKRSREVGIKKILGSKKSGLIGQFLLESFIMTLFAIFCAAILVSLSLPFFNNLTEKIFEPVNIFGFQSSMMILLLGCLVCLFSGGYPAFFLSSIAPIAALKNKISKHGKDRGVRKGLVVFQFMISAGLIIATLIVSQQMSYILNKDVGYDKEQVLVMRSSWLLGDKETAFKNKIISDSRVQSVTMSGHLPAGPSNSNMSSFYPTNKREAARRMTIYHVDDQYIPTMGIELVTGRNFSNNLDSELSNMIINETAARILGFRDGILDQSVTMTTDNQGGKAEFTVIGIVKDFHFRSLHQLIEPMIILNRKNSGMIVKVQSTDMAGLIASMNQTWQDFQVEEPFTYSLLDDSFKQVYAKEQNLGTIVQCFALLAIFIACLGLFGLVTFTAEQRFKEIGIRKVLGSSVSQIVTLLSKDFLKLVFISFLLALPLSYYLMNQWLQDFAYRIEISWWIFALAGLVTLLIAFITMGFKSIKAGMANPVDSLRNE